MKKLFKTILKQILIIAGVLFLVACNGGGGYAPDPATLCNKGNYSWQPIGNSIALITEPKLTYFKNKLYLVNKNIESSSFTSTNQICYLDLAQQSPVWNCGAQSALSLANNLVLDESSNYYAYSESTSNIMKYSPYSNSWTQLGIATPDYRIASNLAIGAGIIYFAAWGRNLETGFYEAGYICSLPINADDNTSWMCVANIGLPSTYSAGPYLIGLGEIGVDDTSNFFYNYYTYLSSNSENRGTWIIPAGTQQKNRIGGVQVIKKPLSVDNNLIYVSSACNNGGNSNDNYIAVAVNNKDADPNTNWTYFKMYPQINGSGAPLSIAAGNNKVFYLSKSNNIAQVYELIK